MGAAEKIEIDRIDILADEVATLAAQIDAATHALLTRLREFDDADGFHRFGALSTAHWLSWRTGMQPGAAREHVRVARALADLPLVDEAMRKGELSYSRTRAITRVATRQTEGTFLELAQQSTAAQLEKICRGYRTVSNLDKPKATNRRRYVRRTDTCDGMVRLNIQLEPHEAAVLWEAITAAVDPLDVPAETRSAAGGGLGVASVAPDVSAETRSAAGGNLRVASVAPDVSAETRRTPSEATTLLPLPAANDPSAREERRADGLVAVAEAYVQGAGGTIGSGFELLMMVTRETLRVVDRVPAANGHFDVGGCLPDGAFVPSPVARRIACDAAMVVVQRNAAGDVLDVGRKTRVVPPAIRRALWIRDGGCCRFPGCTNRRHLDAHHIEHWADGGRTSLDNLVLLCRSHHTMLHGGHITVAMIAGDVVFDTHAGHRISSVPPPATASDLECLEAFLREADVFIDERTNEPRWNGDRLDLDHVLSCLYSDHGPGSGGDTVS